MLTFQNCTSSTQMYTLQTDGLSHYSSRHSEEHHSGCKDVRCVLDSQPKVISENWILKGVQDREHPVDREERKHKTSNGLSYSIKGINMSL